MIKKEKNKKKFLGREIATIAIGVILIASVGIVWIGGAIEGAPPVSTYVGSRGPDIPHLLNYQGVLTDSAGDPVLDGTYQMTVGIYDSATGGNLLWSETQNVQVSDGLFNVLLGTVNQIPADVFCGATDRWIGMKVRDDPEMTPRQRIVSVAYAYAAECAQEAESFAPGKDLIIRDADLNVVHWLKINGGSWHKGMETFEGGIEVEDAEGQKKRELSSDGSMKTYDSNGVRRSEEKQTADGLQRSYFGPDGALEWFELFGHEGLIMKDRDGNVGHIWGKGGTSIHKGIEVFEGGIEVEDAEGQKKRELSSDGSVKTYDSNGVRRSEEKQTADGLQRSYFGPDGALQWFDLFGPESLVMFDNEGKIAHIWYRDGNSYHTGTEMFKGGITVGDLEGNVSHKLNPDGTSWHAGLETFDGGIKITGPHHSATWSLEEHGDGRKYTNPDGTKMEEGYWEWNMHGEYWNKWKDLYDKNGDSAGSLLWDPEEKKWEVFDPSGHPAYTVNMNGDSSQTGEHRCGENGGGYTYMKPGEMGVVAPNGDKTATIYPCGTACFSGDGSYGGNVYVHGDLNCGGTKNAVVETANYGNRTTYCEEAAEVYFFDRGEAQLENGEVTVELDPVFLETVTINATNPMLVQLTLTGDCNGVYVAQRTASNFTVRELSGGNTNAGFMWEVAAKRKGYEDTRLEEVI